jgi:hypothetical protein
MPGSGPYIESRCTQFSEITSFRAAASWALLEKRGIRSPPVGRTAGLPLRVAATPATSDFDRPDGLGPKRLIGVHNGLEALVLQWWWKQTIGAELTNIGHKFGRRPMRGCFGPSVVQSVPAHKGVLPVGLD